MPMSANDMADNGTLDWPPNKTSENKNHLNGWDGLNSWDPKW